MELNKCSRCGSFFISSGNVCPACNQKDSADIVKLENYMKEFNMPENIDEISYNTGISVKNLTNPLDGIENFRIFARIKTTIKK